MKNLRLLLCLSIAAFVSHTAAFADSYDSDDATIKKNNDHSAKVCLDNKKTYIVPVSFGDGASWDNVMDHYELSDASKACLASGHAKLSVGSDGGATWSKK